MARIDLTIPSLGNNFVDLRDSLQGDAYNWSWIRPLTQVSYLAIHHTAAPDTQTPQDIANFHIQNNGWGGIGYHFLISKDGTVYYVGDISTARANVANLNDQVIGICLIGNFMAGVIPTLEQIDSAHKLCDFFITSYPDLSNVKSWDTVKGHKELPGQSTACPGDNWMDWKQSIVSPEGSNTTPLTSNARRLQIGSLYRQVLGRDPDEEGLTNYAQSPLTEDEIRKSLVESEEHQKLLETARKVPQLESQLISLQASLDSVNQQVISLQEGRPFDNGPHFPKPDKTLTLAGALINLYKFLFWPRKAES